MNQIDKTDEELRTLFSIITDDIKYAKRHQLAITYYVLLSYAAIIGFYILIRSELRYLPWYHNLWLLLPALFINILGMYHIMDTQKCLCTYRMRLKAIKSRFERLSQSVLNISTEETSLIRAGLAEVLKFFNLTNASKRIKKIEYYRFSRYFWDLAFPFIVFMILGLFYIAWLILNDNLSSCLIFLLVLLANAIFFFPFYFANVHKAKKAEVKSDISLEATAEQGQKEPRNSLE